MSNDYRSIIGLFKKYWTNEPLANATIIIRLLTNSFTLEAGYPTTKTPGNANDSGRSFQTDENGNLPEGLELFCSASSIGGGTKYRVTEPDGVEWDFILDYGDGTPISMQTLRAGGLPAPNSETVIALIESKIALSCIRFDIAQNLTDEQKQQALENLGVESIGSGNLAIGSEIVDSEPLWLLFADEDGKLAQDDDFQVITAYAGKGLKIGHRLDMNTKQGAIDDYGDGRMLINNGLGFSTIINRLPANGAWGIYDRYNQITFAIYENSGAVADAAYPSRTPFTIKLASGQTADGFSYENSLGDPLLRIDNDGKIRSKDLVYEQGFIDLNAENGNAVRLGYIDGVHGSGYYGIRVNQQGSTFSQGVYNAEITHHGIYTNAYSVSGGLDDYGNLGISSYPFNTAFLNKINQVKEGAGYAGLFPNNNDWGIYRNTLNGAVSLLFNDNGTILRCDFS